MSKEKMAYSRIPQLDLLRGIAVLLVMFRHIHFLNIPSNYLFGIRIAANISYLGWVGVDLFFVLSGFLVSGLLFKEFNKNQKIDFKKFYIRRSFKIIPSFLIFIFITFFLDSLLKWCVHDSTYGHLLQELFFVQNYFSGLHSHTWSLAVEEHFYLFLPLFIFLFLKYTVNRISYAIIIFIMLTAFIRYFMFHLYVIDLSKVVFYTHFRIDTMMFGVLVSYFYHFHYEKLKMFITKNSLWLMLVSIILILMGTLKDVRSKYVFTIGFPMIGIGFMLLLLVLLFKEWKNRIIYTPILFIGVNSSNIYLWHEPINLWLKKNVLSVSLFDNYLYIFLYFTLSFLIGSFFTRFFEQKALKLRNKIFPGN